MSLSQHLQNENIKFAANSASDTLAFAKDFSKNLCRGDIVCLHGDIGVGKTVFTRGISCSDAVCSPTFSIMNIYDGNPPIYHFDLYRLNTEDELYESGLMEYIERGDGISVIEWPDIFGGTAEGNIYDVYISKNLDIDENYREIVVKKR